MTQTNPRSVEPRSDLFDPLVSVLWADKRMAFAQVRALDMVARLLHVEDAAQRITRIPESAAPPPPTRWRPVVYALAVWIASMDGRVEGREAEVLSQFAARWGIDPETEFRLNRLAWNLASLAGGRPTPAQLLALVRAAQRVSSDGPVEFAA